MLGVGCWVRCRVTGVGRRGEWVAGRERRWLVAVQIHDASAPPSKSSAGQAEIGDRPSPYPTVSKTQHLTPSPDSLHSVPDVVGFQDVLEDAGILAFSEAAPLGSPDDNRIGGTFKDGDTEARTVVA